MSSDPSDRLLLDDIEEISRIIRDFESLVDRFESRLRQSQEEYENLIQESGELVGQARKQLHRIHGEARRVGLEPLPQIDIPDRKLLSTWQTLYQYHDGATAEEMAVQLEKHRTTVSTYLNTLTHMKFASKERRGHEIYYHAILR